jgi:hypothetical protein
MRVLWVRTIVRSAEISTPSRSTRRGQCRLFGTGPLRFTPETFAVTLLGVIFYFKNFQSFSKLYFEPEPTVNFDRLNFESCSANKYIE